MPWAIAQAKSDHPRVCGECVFAWLSLSFETGSSPRVRGMLSDSYEAYYQARIIPACAGNA